MNRHVATGLALMALAAPQGAMAQPGDDRSQPADPAQPAGAAAERDERDEPGVPDLESRAGGDRPTVQRRYASKQNLLTLSGALATHVRDDFYDSWGVGAQLAYYISERWGFEARALFLRTRLDGAALDLQERIGLVPDARPQNRWLLLGARYSPGYGKMLMWDSFLVHFDPQLVIHLGVATAEKRWLPTSTVAFSLMTHWRWGIKASVDLGVTTQFERRERGWVFTTGFAPVLGLGWGRAF